mgnify:CR=1 FL=1
MSEENNNEQEQIHLPDSIFLNPSEYKTTSTIESLNELIPKEERVEVTDFLHILLSSLRDMSACPLHSFEKAYPPKLRKKPYSREEIRRMKKRDNLPIDEKIFIQRLKEKISKIPDFSESYDYLLKND